MDSRDNLDPNRLSTSRPIAARQDLAGLMPAAYTPSNGGTATPPGAAAAPSSGATNGSYASTSTTNSSTDSNYFPRLVANNAGPFIGNRSSPTPAAMARNRSQQGYGDTDTPLDSQAALSQILNGIADMQREVCGLFLFLSFESNLLLLTLPLPPSS